MHLRRLILWSVMVPLLAARAGAQDTAPAAQAEKIEPHGAKGPVSGTERTVITAAELRARNVQDLTELFQGRVPGIVGSSYGAGSLPSFRSRGVTASGDDARPRVFINDVELPDPVTLREISPDVIDSMVVLPGAPAGTFSGVDATGGIVQLYTKAGAATPWSVAAKVSGGEDVGHGDGGSAAFQDHVLEASGTVRPLQYYLAGGYTSEGAWAPSYDNHVWHGLASASATYRWASLSVFGMQHQRGFVPPNDRYGAPSGASTPRYEEYGLYTTSFGTSVRMTPWSWLAVHATAGRSRLVDTLGQTQARLVVAADTLLANERVSEMTTSYSYDAMLTLPSYGMMTPTLWLGGNVSHDLIKVRYSERTSPSASPVFLSGIDATQNRSGQFAQLGLRVGEALTLGAGVRRDSRVSLGTSNSDVGQYRPRFDARYVMNLWQTKVTARGAYGRVASSLQNVDDQMSGSGYIIMANAGLRPKELIGEEVGIDIERGAVALGITAFDQAGKGAPVFTQVDVFFNGTTYIPVYEYINGLDTRNRGATAYARATAGPFSAMADVTAFRSRYEHIDPRLGFVLSDGPRIIDEPHQSAFASVSYAHSVFTISTSARYLGSHRGYSVTAPPSYVATYPGFALYDVDASYGVTPSASVIGYVHNLTNTERFSVYDAEYVRGRRIGVGVRVQR